MWNEGSFPFFSVMNIYKEFTHNFSFLFAYFVTLFSYWLFFSTKKRCSRCWYYCCFSGTLEHCKCMLSFVEINWNNFSIVFFYAKIITMSPIIKIMIAANTYSILLAKYSSTLSNLFKSLSSDGHLLYILILDYAYYLFTKWEQLPKG